MISLPSVKQRMRVDKPEGLPILFISGQDDATWPSSMMAEMVTQRLKAHAFPYTFCHLSYPAPAICCSFPIARQALARSIIR